MYNRAIGKILDLMEIGYSTSCNEIMRRQAYTITKRVKMLLDNPELFYVYKLETSIIYDVVMDIKGIFEEVFEFQLNDDKETICKFKEILASDPDCVDLVSGVDNMFDAINDLSKVLILRLNNQEVIENLIEGRDKNNE